MWISILMLHVLFSILVSESLQITETIFTGITSFPYTNETYSYEVTTTSTLSCVYHCSADPGCNTAYTYRENSDEWRCILIDEDATKNTHSISINPDSPGSFWTIVKTCPSGLIKYHGKYSVFLLTHGSLLDWTISYISMIYGYPEPSGHSRVTTETYG